MGHPVLRTHLPLQYDTRCSPAAANAVATAAADRGMLIEEAHSLVSLILLCIHPPLKMPQPTAMYYIQLYLMTGGTGINYVQLCAAACRRNVS